MQAVSQNWIDAHAKSIVPISDIEISYGFTDAEALDDATSISDTVLDIAKTDEIMASRNYERYATLEHNGWLLDNKAGLADRVQHTGYVSSVLSSADKDCTFATHPIVTINFTHVHTVSIPGIRITWSTTFGEFANSFNVYAYNGSTLVNSVSVTENYDTDVVAEFEDGLSGYDKIVIEIVSWCLPKSRARIEQIVLGDYKDFARDELIGFEHSQSVDLLSLTLPKAEVVFKINNIDSKWNPDNPQGVYKYLAEKQEITVKYGYKINGAIEWINCGTFYLSDWNTPQNGITATFTARDLIEYMNNTFDKSQISSSITTLYELAEMAFTQSNLPNNNDGSVKWVIDSSLSNIAVSMPDDFNYTCAEVVQLCANAGCCVMYQDRDGQFHIEQLNSELTNYRINQFVSYKNAEYDQDKWLQVVNVNDGLGNFIVENVANGETQEINNPLIQTAEQANNVAAWVASILVNRNNLSGEYRADPRMDALDKITVENKFTETTGVANTVCITSIKYSYNGAFRGSYEGRIIE